MSDSLVDPIKLLKESLASHLEITLADKELVFAQPPPHSSLKIPLDVPTAWARSDGKGFYSLGTLWYWMSNRDQNQPTYMRNANQVGIPIVPFNDRDEVTKYFTGAITHSSHIDERVRSDTMIKRSMLKAGGKVHQELAKKREAKGEEKKERREKKLSELLHENEKKIYGKTNCL